jgi:hypothetical protein
MESWACLTQPTQVSVSGCQQLRWTIVRPDFCHHLSRNMFRLCEARFLQYESRLNSTINGYLRCRKRSFQVRFVGDLVVEIHAKTRRSFGHWSDRRQNSEREGTGASRATVMQRSPLTPICDQIPAFSNLCQEHTFLFKLYLAIPCP